MNKRARNRFNRLQKNMLRDALYNCYPRSGAHSEYAKGMLVGVVSTLMAQRFTFSESVECIFDLVDEGVSDLEHKHVIDAMPSHWSVDYSKLLNQKVQSELTSA